MSDPLLNSVHLEAPRREDFRRARQVVLAARGEYTACLESSPAAALERLAEAPVKVDQPCVRLHAGGQHALKLGLNTLGRLPDNDVIVADAHASRRHCTIVVHSTQACEVYDMASKNGTYLNGTKIAGPAPLHPGDEIKIGDARIVFCSAGDTGPAADAAPDHGRTERLD